MLIRSQVEHGKISWLTVGSKDPKKKRGGLDLGIAGLAVRSCIYWEHYCTWK